MTLVPYVVDGKETIIAVFRCSGCSMLLAIDAVIHRPGTAYDCPCGEEAHEDFDKEIPSEANSLKKWVEGSASVRTSFEVPPKLLVSCSKEA